jgi:hypothetical protein
MAKHDPLKLHLEKDGASSITLTFARIEQIIDAQLAPYARKGDARWWMNEDEDGRHVQAKAWRLAGYKVDGVDFQNETVIFIKF